MLKNKIIGILGGIGPESSATFYLDLIKSIQENFNITSTSDYPQIIINNIAVADLVNKNISKTNIEPIVKGLKELDKFQPNFNIIICNSSYSFYDYLKSNTKTELLNLADIVKRHLKNHRIKNIGIVGTNITVSSLYEFYDNRKYLVSEKHQLIINNLITSFNKGKQKATDKKELEIIINNLLNQGAEFVLLACTELGLIGKGIDNTIDPMELLKDEIIEKLKK